MINIKDPKDCCGCTACASICTRDAITMKPDALGFLYPHVDTNKCVDCGRCEKVCQFHDHYNTGENFNKPLAFAARHKNIDEVMKSRSGAAFVAISDYILEQGGVVYGAGYKDHYRVAHKRATTKEERNEFRGSKYVQSDLTGVFRLVKEDLKKGLSVLFSGTPCQTSGLRAYIGKKLNERLYLMDIVCHSVPSPYIWRDYINYLESQHHSKICYVNFRDKELYGWKSHKETFKFERETEKTSLERKRGSFTFTSLFTKNIAMRHSCSTCYFTNLHRPSDITIADYWGWERTDPYFNADNKGCSLVLCNTEKGKHLFEAIKDRMNVIPAEIKNIMQTHLSKPSEAHPERQAFEDYYARYGFEKTIRKFGLMGWRKTIHELKKKFLRKLNIFR